MYAFGCGLASDSSLECKIQGGAAFFLAFPFISVDFEEKLVIAIVLEILYLYSLTSLIHGLYLVIKKRLSAVTFVSSLIILAIVWGGYPVFLAYEKAQKKEQRTDTYEMSKNIFGKVSKSGMVLDFNKNIFVNGDKANVEYPEYIKTSYPYKKSVEGILYRHLNFRLTGCMTKDSPFLYLEIPDIVSYVEPIRDGYREKEDSYIDSVDAILVGEQKTIAKDLGLTLLKSDNQSNTEKCMNFEVLLERI